MDFIKAFNGFRGIAFIIVLINYYTTFDMPIWSHDVLRAKQLPANRPIIQAISRKKIFEHNQLLYKAIFQNLSMPYTRAALRVFHKQMDDKYPNYQSFLFSRQATYILDNIF